MLHQQKQTLEVSKVNQLEDRLLTGLWCGFIFWASAQISASTYAIRRISCGSPDLFVQILLFLLFQIYHKIQENES